MSLFGSTPRRRKSTGVSPFCLATSRTKVTSTLDRHVSISMSGGAKIAALAIAVRSPLVSTTLASAMVRYLRGCVASCHAGGTHRSLTFARGLFGRTRRGCCRTRRGCTHFVSNGRGVVVRDFHARRRHLRGRVGLTCKMFARISRRLRLTGTGMRRVAPICAMMRPTAIPLEPTGPGGVVVLVNFMFLTNMNDVK